MSHFCLPPPSFLSLRHIAEPLLTHLSVYLYRVIPLVRGQKHDPSSLRYIAFDVATSATGFLVSSNEAFPQRSYTLQLACK